MCFMFPSGSNPMILYEGSTHPELVKFSLLFEDLIVPADQPALQRPDLRLQHGVLVFCKTKKG